MREINVLNRDVLVSLSPTCDTVFIGHARPTFHKVYSSPRNLDHGPKSVESSDSKVFLRPRIGFNSFAFNVELPTPNFSPCCVSSRGYRSHATNKATIIHQKNVLEIKLQPRRHTQEKTTGAFHTTPFKKRAFAFGI